MQYSACLVQQSGKKCNKVQVAHGLSRKLVGTYILVCRHDSATESFNPAARKLKDYRGSATENKGSQSYPLVFSIPFGVRKKFTVFPCCNALVCRKSNRAGPVCLADRWVSHFGRMDSTRSTRSVKAEKGSHIVWSSIPRAP